MKSNFATGNRLQETGNWLPESKNSGNLRKFWEKLFWKTKLCYVCFLKNLFNTSLVKSSWFLLLNLESSWFLLMKLEINLDLELVNSILKSFFGFFVIIFVIIKTTWIKLIHHHEACFYRYNVIVVWLSRQQSMTFFPLRSQPPPNSSVHHMICVGHMFGNHFVQAHWR